MKITPIQCLKDNYAYIIHNDNSKNAAVVDPSESRPVIDFLEKKNLKLKYILNTHHHFDHIGGNIDLKRKYNSKVVGFDGDKHRIPGIDITLKDNEEWNFENSIIKVIHIPGHTLGHICFFFQKEKIAFTGDTLFSLGCGRIFEGDYKQMLTSLNKIKELPKETKIYCGHEYTYKNAEFCIKFDNKNILLKKKFEVIKKLRFNKLPTIPTTLEDEINCNIFLRCNQKTIKNGLNMQNHEDLEVFSKVRDLKDNF